MQCFFPQYALKYISTPYFILNSAYDVYQVIFFYDIFCFFNILYSTIVQLWDNYNLKCQQFHHILAPPSADLHGHWNKCRLNPAACTADQIAILQGPYFKLLFLSSLWNSMYWEVSSVYNTKMFLFCEWLYI